MNNVLKLKKFLQNLKYIKIDKMIFASSAAVYGNMDRKKISEKSTTRPLSPYGLSKLQGENLLSYFSKKYQFNSYNLRFFNIAGANAKIGCGPFNKSYKHIFNILLKNREFFINGQNYNTKDGTCIRDYVNVSDVCEVILKLLKRKETKSESYVLNCGSGRGTSVKSIAYMFKKKIKKDLVIRVGKRRLGDPTSIVANNLKLKKLIKINFKKSNLNTIMKEYNEWYNR